MSEWWKYRPEDFLLFSPRAYWRMFELQNEALGALAILLLGIGGIVIFLAARRTTASMRSTAIILAVLWAFVGYTFLWNRYAGINWAIAYVAPAFGLQAALLLLLGVRSDLMLQPHRVPAGIGYFLLAVATAGMPLLAPLQGRERSTGEVFGVAPDPTVIATLGFLLLLRGRLVWLLAPIPVLWCLFSGITLRTMGEAQAWVPFVAVALTIIAWVATIIRPPPRLPA
jgi:hypothetical protein